MAIHSVFVLEKNMISVQINFVWHSAMCAPDQNRCSLLAIISYLLCECARPEHWTIYIMVLDS